MPFARLVHITTVPQSLGFLAGQCKFMAARGFEVHAISSPGKRLEEFGLQEGVRVHPVAMTRQITPFRDILALVRMWRTLRWIRPTIVHSHTPKGGLLGMVAAWLARVPVRIYHVHGLPFITANGWKRVLLRWSERVSCHLAHQVLCVSESVRQVVVDERLCPATKIKVLLNGSINGVDASVKFNPDRFSESSKAAIRNKYGIPHQALVVGYAGRIVRDKGLVDLAEAWGVLREEFPSAHLLVIGEFEQKDPIPAATDAALHKDPRIHLTGRISDMPPMYAIMDVLVLPSYREGFPMVPLEASAMGLPVVATDTPGCRDAVVHGLTGTLVPPRAPSALAEAIRRYLLHPDLRREHGSAGRKRALDDFRQEAVWEALYAEYKCLLNAGQHVESKLKAARGKVTSQSQ